MQRKDFYHIFNHYEPILSARGFKKHLEGTYDHPSNLRIQIVLDKHGWDAAYGWGFILRAFNLDSTISSNGVTEIASSVDLNVQRLSRLYHSNLEQNVKELYRVYDNSVTQKLVEQLETGWWAFYDEQGLGALLDLTLDYAISAGLKWKQENPYIPHKKRIPTTEEITQMKKNLDSLMNREDK